jgi:DNA polymerase-4
MYNLKNKINMARSIVHMDMDTFFVSCERLTNSKLNGLPLIIGGGDRGVVASCSYEARTFGVRSAMPIKMALRLCPQAKVMKGDLELYSKLSHDITQVIEEKAPIAPPKTDFTLENKAAGKDAVSKFDELFK